MCIQWSLYEILRLATIGNVCSPSHSFHPFGDDGLQRLHLSSTGKISIMNSQQFHRIKVAYLTTIFVLYIPAGHVPEAAPTVIHGIIVLGHVLEVDPAHAEALALVHAIRTAPVQKGPLTGAPVKMVMEMVLLG